MITWGSGITGREAKGMEVFNEALGFWGAKQQAGDVEAVHVGTVETGNTESFAGYLLVEGDRAKLDEIIASEEYKVINVKAVLIVRNFTINHCDTGDAIGQSIERYTSVREKLGF